MEQVTNVREVIANSAKLFAQSEIAGQKAVEELAGALTEKPTFTTWESIRQEWTADYIAARKCNDEAGAKAWQRIAKRMEETYNLFKPKAETKKARRQ